MKIQPPPLPMSCMRRTLSPRAGRKVARQNAPSRKYTHQGMESPPKMAPRMLRPPYTSIWNTANHQYSDREARPLNSRYLWYTVDTDCEKVIGMKLKVDFIFQRMPDVKVHSLCAVRVAKALAYSRSVSRS